MEMNTQTTPMEVLPEYDVFIHTSDGTRIPAHTTILVSLSPILCHFIFLIRYPIQGLTIIVNQ